MHMSLRIFLAASAAALVAVAWRAMPAQEARVQEVHFEPIPEDALEVPGIAP